MSDRKAQLRAELARIELDELMASLEREYAVLSHAELKAIIREAREQRVRADHAEEAVRILRAQNGKQETGGNKL